MKVVPLTQGYEALVDDVDFDLVIKHRWRVLKSGRHLYAFRTEKGPLGVNGKRSHKMILMHRVLTAAPSGMVVDHKDRNGLNNTRKNMRVCNKTESMANNEKMRGKSKFKGVHWNKEKGKWQAKIGPRYLGRFESETAAAAAYDKAAILSFGEYARINKV